MSDINMLVQENLEAVKDHLNRHKGKYLAAVALGALGTKLAHDGKGKLDHFRHKNNIVNHLKNNKEVYTGATAGALSSLISSKGSKHRLAKLGVSTGIGALGGALLKNDALRNELSRQSKK